MAENTAIQWADDTVNFWWGCTKIAPGCKECYAEGISTRFVGDVWGQGKPRLYMPNAAETVRKLERKAAKEGRPRLVFVNSMSDFFEDHDGPVVDREGLPLFYAAGVGVHKDKAPAGVFLRVRHLRADAFRLFDQCQHLRFILLTKRPENVRRMWPRTHGSPKDQTAPDPSRVETGRYWHRSNVWLLASISDQATADAMIPPLLECADLVPVLGVSAEPLLGPVSLDANKMGVRPWHDEPWLGGLRWVIIGGESGPHARQCDIAWVRSLVQQCQGADVACFVKQLGSWPVDRLDLSDPGRTNFDLDLHDSKGGDPEEWPADLRVRQFPKVNHA